MKPHKSSRHDPQLDLFRAELENIISPSHPLVKLTKAVCWDRLDEVFGKTFCPDNGRPGIATRLMVALHYLKYLHDLSDEAVVAGWVENPYWQHLSGMQFFEHEPPIDASSMTRWRKRIGEAGAEEMLRETIETGIRLKAVKKTQLKRMNIDTTVQEKFIRFPTDARLYDRARERLVAAAKENGIKLRQGYSKVGKKMMIKQGRYAHARQFRRAAKCTSKLKTYLGRVIRDIERKCPVPDERMSELLEVSRRIHAQQRKDKNKVYSVHEPHTECICKGKAHKRYEFGNKISVAVTSKGGWFVGTKAFHGNPYDGHTLAAAVEQAEKIMGGSPVQIFVDRGYRGHDYEGDIEVHVDRQRRGRIPQSLWRWMKRRAAVEPGIGHLKQEHRMERNRLKGKEGDAVNSILSAAGMNFSKLLKFLAAFLRLLGMRLHRPRWQLTLISTRRQPTEIQNAAA